MTLKISIYEAAEGRKSAAESFSGGGGSTLNFSKNRQGYITGKVQKVREIKGTNKAL
jgi:hypothetical protein